jgi:hypothetical protein
MLCGRGGEHLDEYILFVFVCAGPQRYDVDRQCAGARFEEGSTAAPAYANEI